MDVAKICEVGFLVCFFFSWPVTIRKSLKSRTSKGRSVLFEFFLFFGYIAGIIGKFWSLHIYGEFQYVTILYLINTSLVFVDICLFYRNRKIDEQNDAAKTAAHS